MTLFVCACVFIYSRCPGTDKCIPENWYCDQNEDCPDASDERDCFDDDGSTYVNDRYLLIEEKNDHLLANSMFSNN